MVYGGKPSTGCATCKKRKIKCDEQRPICGNCIKSKRACPGYRDQFDIMFRDENQAMQRRTKKRLSASGRKSEDDLSSPIQTDTPSTTHTEPSPGSTPLTTPTTSPHVTEMALWFPTSTSSAQTSSPAAVQYSGVPFMGQAFDIFNPEFANQPISPFDSPSTEQAFQFPVFQNASPGFDPMNTTAFPSFMYHIDLNAFTSLTNSVPPVITLPSESEAIPFFFNNFINLPQQQESIRGFLELLNPVYSRARPSSALYLATNAVALACVGNYPGRSKQLNEAMDTYGRAIRRLIRDVEDPVTSKLDETILATLVLSLYEIIMSTNSSIDGWAHHVDAAVRLTTLRGNDQFNNSLSYAVFRAVRTMMIASYIQRGKKISKFPGQMGWRGKDLGEENPANRLTLLCIDLPNIRVRADSLRSELYSPSLEQEARALMETAHMIDTNLEQWYDTLPPKWHHRVVNTVHEVPEDIAEAEAWLGPQHVYDDIDLASTVNDSRVYRIFCHRVILACIAWLKKADDADTDAHENAHNRAIEVIQKMVDDISASLPFHITYEMQPMAYKSGKEQYAAEAYGAYHLLWPLYIASKASTVPQRQRDWLVGRLTYIGTKFGLSTAQILSKRSPSNTVILHKSPFTFA